MGQIHNERPFELKAGTVTVFGEFSEKLKNNKKAAALGTTPLALILSACGSSDDATTASSNVLTLTKSADTYSASAVTGFTVADSSTAKFDVANAASNAYEIKLDASGTGVLEFDFVDAGDTVTLITGSKTSGFTTLKVTDGTLDATNADLTGITRVEVASGIKISLAQIKEIPTIVASSATSEITVQVTTEAEATELVSLISAGTVTVFADTNPIKLVAAPTATVATETLETKQSETTASVKPAAEAPVDTAVTDTTTDTDTTTGTDDTTTDTTTDTGTTTGGGTSVVVSSTPDFAVIKSGVGAYIVGTTNGDVTVTQSGDLDTFTPSTGVAVSKLSADITSLRVDDLTLSATATFADSKTITGNGNISLTALEGDAAADLSNITASGTKTVNVGGDVTFTGDLGTFAVTVASGATLSTTIAKATGLTITGAGTVAITDDATADTNLTSIGTTGINFGTDNTISIASAKTLTLDADHAATATSGITGAGNVTVEDDGDAANSSMLITATGVVTVDAGTGNDTIDLGNAENVTAADTIDGGGGTDELQITADAGTTGAVLDDLVDIDTVTVEAGSTATNDAKVTLQYTSANTDSMTITAAALTNSSAAFTFVGSDSEVQGALNIIGGAGADTITGGAGTDAITGGDGVDSLTGGSGTDVFIFDADDSAAVAVATAGASTGGDTIQDFASGDGIRITGELTTGFIHTSHVLVGDGTSSGDASTTDDEDDFTTATYLVARDADATNGFDTAVIVTSDGSTAGIADDATAQAVTSYNVTLNSAGAAVTLGALADTVTGGAGNDTVIGGDGADTIDGGDGTDTVSYADIASSGTNHSVANASLIGVAVNLSAADVAMTTIDTALDTAVSSADYFTFGSAAIAAGKAGFILGAADAANGGTLDTLSNIEAVTGSARADYIALGAGGMSAAGGDGNDTVVGGAGNDTFTGGDGSDVLTGGDGTDIVSYADIAASGTNHGVANASLIGVAVNLSAASIAMTTIDTALDTAVSSANYFTFGSAALAAGKAGLILTAADASGGGDLDTLTTIESVVGSARADYIALGAGGMTAAGGAGNDTIVGGAGADTITGGAGVDIINGGDGADIFVLEQVASSAGADTIIEFVSGTDKLNVDGALDTGDVTLVSSAFTTWAGDATATDNAIVNITSASTINATNVAAKFEAAGGSDAAKMILADGSQVIVVVQDDDAAASTDYDAVVYNVDNTGDTITATLIATLDNAADSSSLVIGDFV